MVTKLEMAREAILDLLIAQVTDPESRGDNSWIRGVGAGNQDSFVGYPLISVAHSNQEPPTKTFSNTKRTRPGSVIIMVYTNNDIQLEQLADDVVAAIEDNEATLNAAGLNKVMVTVGDGDFILDNGDELHSLPITVEYTV